MGAAKDIWLDEVEKIGEDFASGHFSRDEAISQLRRLGLDSGEAEIMLDEATA